MSELIITERSNIVAIADAVRNKSGSTGGMTLGGIINGINGISTGVELPALSNPATETETFEGYEFIDQDGNKKTGTFTIDNELNTQEDLISQIATALEGKASGGGSEVNFKTCTINVACLNSTYVTGYAYTAVENNELVVKTKANFMGDNSMTNLTFNNVLCSSSLYVSGGGAVLMGMSVAGETVRIRDLWAAASGVFQVSPIAGAVDTITFYESD